MFDGSTLNNTLSRHLAFTIGVKQQHVPPGSEYLTTASVTYMYRHCLWAWKDVNA